MKIFHLCFTYAFILFICSVLVNNYQNWLNYIIPLVRPLSLCYNHNTCFAIHVNWVVFSYRDTHEQRFNRKEATHFCTLYLHPRRMFTLLLIYLTLQHLTFNLFVYVYCHKTLEWRCIMYVYCDYEWIFCEIFDSN
jgi:hypothetical protein